MRQLTFDDMLDPRTLAVALQMYEDVPKIVRGRQLRNLTERIGDDEAISAAGEAIARALRTYIPNGRTAFKTYAFCAILRKLISTVEQSQRKSHRTTTDAESDGLASVVSHSASDAAADVAVILAKLPPAASAILKTHYLDGVSVEAMAKRRRVSQQAVRLQLGKARKLAATAAGAVS